MSGSDVREETYHQREWLGEDPDEFKRDEDRPYGFRSVGFEDVSPVMFVAIDVCHY